MPDDAVPDDGGQWSPAARAEAARAADELSRAVREHAALLADLEGGAADVAQLFTASERLAAVAEAYQEAVFLVSGTFLSWETDPDDDVADDEDDDLLDGAPASHVSLRYRADFAVVDPALVLEAGREAYREEWPDERPADVDAHVPGVEAALLQVAHVRGVTALDDLPGLEPLADWAQVVVLDPPGDDDEDWPDDPFALG